MKIINSFILLCLCTFIAMVNLYASEKHKDVDVTDVVGKKEFFNYCASCHGSNGKGDGPIVHFLKRKPKNLTQLSKDNGNAFPFERIWGVFDGTYVMAEHGSSEMPIWGYKFIQETQKENEPSTVAKARALNIILYLQIIQE
jgi:mono/diheme cytochrome c family protein